MTIVLNGTTGITNDGGYTGDGVSFADTTPANTLVTTTGGNVGIGTSSPAYKLHASGTGAIGIIAQSTSASGATMSMYGSDGAQGFIGTLSNHVLTLATNGTEKARIDTSGNLLVGQTSRALSEKLGVTNSGGIAAYFNGSTGSSAFTGDDLNHYMITCQSKAGTSAAHYQIGFINSVGSTVGGITHNNSNTTYSTSSDYRLKENILPMTGALDKVGLLKPCTYVWKETGEASQGFIAHELQEVIPDAVVGEKDALNEDGSIRPQGIDTSYLVATLTAAIQEQQAIITDLKSRIETLEAK
jgi:hypothetical protein